LQKKLIFILFIIMLAIMLIGCDSNQSLASNTTDKTVTNQNSNNGILTEVGTVQTVFTQTPKIISSVASEGSSATIAKLPLPYEVQSADKIFTAQVARIGELIWDTPDGKEPSAGSNFARQPGGYTPEQLTPVELLVMTAYKGNLKPGDKVNLLLPGAPGSKPYGGNWPNFPKLGATNLWFTGKDEVDYRRGLSANPLKSLIVQTVYNLQPNEQWQSTIDNTSLITLDQLTQAIKNPPGDPKLTAAAMPSPTLGVRSAQTFNPVQFYELNKTESIILKGGPRPGEIKDKSIIQAVLAVLDKPQIVSNDTSLPGGADLDKHVFLIFVKSDDNTNIGFDYNFKDNYLIWQSPDNFKIPVSPELSKVLGLS
jgi:hypothetical protein